MTDLVDRFAAWERWALTVSNNAAAAIERGERPPRLSPTAGKDVTDRLVDAEIAAAETMGITHTEVHERLIEARRAGSSITEAVTRLGEAGR